MRAYTNREDLDFSTVAELPPVQQWDLQENLNGNIEYPTQCAAPCHLLCPLTWQWTLWGTP